MEFSDFDHNTCLAELTLMNFSGIPDCQTILDLDHVQHFDGCDLDPNNLQTVTSRKRFNMITIVLLNYLWDDWDVKNQTKPRIFSNEFSGTHFWIQIRPAVLTVLIQVITIYGGGGWCEKQRRRQACASAQTDQRLCYSLFGKHHI